MIRPANNQDPKIDASTPLNPHGSTRPSPVTESLRVLITDDDPINRKLLRVLLEMEGHSVVEAKNGIVALQLLEVKQVDAVISDILMPEMDGYRLCFEIRKNPKLSSLPFIVYTASYTSPADERIALKFGADRFIRKPASGNEIIKTLFEVVTSAKKPKPSAAELPQEAAIMREYSQVLVNKLEQKQAELSAANVALEERAKLAEAAAAVTGALVRAANLPDMLQSCTDAIVKHLGIGIAEVWTLNRTDNVLELRAASGHYTHIHEGYSRLPVGWSEIGRIASEQESYFSDAVIGDPRIECQEWAKHEGMVGFAGYPLMIGGQLVGVMAVFARRLIPQSTRDVLGSVAQNIAVGIQRQLAESQLRASEERFRELAENINEIFFIAGPGGNSIHYVSPGYEQITRRKVAELYNNPHAWLEMIHPDDRPRVEQAMREDSAGLEQEYRILRSDGTLRWLRSRAFPIKDKAGDGVRVVGIAMDITERKVAEEKVSQNLQRIRALHEIDLAITSTLDLQTVVKVLLQKMEVFFPYPTVTNVRLLNRKTGELEALACHNIDLDEWKNSFRVAPGKRARAVLDTKRPLILRNVLTDAGSADYSLYKNNGLVSYVGVPLVAKDEALGVLNLYTREEHEFSEEEIEFLKTLAGQAAIAIHNAQLYEETERRRVEAEELARVARSLTETLDMQVVGDRIVSSIRELFGVRGATLRLLQPDGSFLWLASCGEVFSQGPAGNTVPPGMGLTNRAVTEGRPVWSPNVLDDPEIHLTEAMRDYQLRSGNHSMIAVPLRAHDKTIGALTLSDETGRTYSDAEIALLNTFADQVALALENARLYDHTQRHLTRIQGVSEINNAIASTLSLRNVLDVLLEKIELNCPIAVACGVRLFDDTTGKMVPLAARHIPFEEWRQEVATAKGRLTKLLMETKGPVAILNMHADSRTSMNNFSRRHGLVSYLGVPLIVRDKFIGNLVIYTKEEHAFSAEEIEFFTNLGSQAAIAIHNARLYEETERRRHEAEELARVARSLTEILDPTIVGERIVTSVRELFGVQGSTLRLRQADGSFRHLASSGEAFSQTSVGDVLPSDVGLTSRAIAEGKPFWSKDILNDPEILLTDEMRDYQIRSGNRSMIVVPLHAHEKLIGTLTLSDRTGRTYSDNEAALLQTFADQAALALENARLFEKNELSKRELETTNRFLDKSLSQLSGLYTAMTPLGLSESLGEMMNGIVGRLIEATGADAGLFRFWNREAGDYPVIGHMGYSREFIEGARPERAEGAVGWVIQHGEPIIAIDIASDDRLKRKAQLKMGFQSCAILPLRVHDVVRGVIQISSRTRGYFDEEQKNHLLAVARQMSIALENRELFYSLKASRDELERANRVKDEFLSVMSHELRTPLSVVLGYSRMFQEQQLGPLTKDQQQAVNVVLRNSQELLEMIESIMDATKIEAGSMTAEMDSVSPLELLREIKVAYDVPVAKNVRLEWQLPQSLPLLWSDMRKLRQILTNLINNAIKFTEEGRIVIAAEEKRSGGGESAEQWIEFRVSDSGVGIPPEECEKIFERFHQVDSSQTRRYEGVGLGLHIVKSFTEMLGGRVSVRSQLGEGSTFTVSLPVKTAS